MASPQVVVRPAVAGDLPGMAKVHVETWKTTYRGIVPDERLDGMTVEADLARGFGQWVLEPPPETNAFVGTSADGAVIGFAVCGPNRDAESHEEYAGEMGAIYVLKGHQGKGIGRALVRSVAGHLVSVGKPAMLVWVLARNPYRRFYEKLGGVKVLERTIPVAGTPLPEVGYGWKDVRAIP